MVLLLILVISKYNKLVYFYRYSFYHGIRDCIGTLISCSTGCCASGCCIGGCRAVSSVSSFVVVSAVSSVSSVSSFVVVSSVSSVSFFFVILSYFLIHFLIAPAFP